jgi:hypothetical protein
MNSRAMRALSGDELPGLPVDVARAGDAASLLLDSAISHCEKLRRVLQLEEWINATPDNSIFGPTRRKWQEQRDRLLSELQLERLSAADAGDAGSRESQPSGEAQLETETVAAGH